MVRAALLVALFAFTVGCSQAATTTETAAPADAVRGADVVIAQIVTHDSKVALLGGGRDLRVVIRTIDGTMVADRLSLAELRARDPELYAVVTSAFAANASGSSYVDATLDLGHIN